MKPDIFLALGKVLCHIPCSGSKSVTKTYFTLCILGNCSCFCCCLLTFFKINFFKKLFQEHYQSVKPVGSRCRS